MKVIYLYISLFFFTTLGFSQSPKKILAEEDQRKFDYFLYESLREKMLGNYEKSAVYLTECLKINPTSSACMYELANLFIQQNQFRKAQGLLESSLKYDPYNQWIKSLLGEVYQQNEEYDKAILLYKDLAKTTSTNEEFLYYLSQLYIQKKNYKEALKMLEEIEKKLGTVESIMLDKQKVYLQMGDNKAAINELEKLIKKYPSEIKYRSYLGDTYLIINNLNQAESTYLNILKIDSTYESVYFSLSNLYLIKKDTVLFRSYFIKGIESKNVNIDFKLQKLVPFIIDSKKNDSFFTTENWSHIYDKLLLLSGVDQRVYYFYGNYLKQIGDNERALKLFKQGIVYDYNNEQYWNDLLFLEVSNNQIEWLLTDSKEALRYFPENGVFYLLHASGLMQNKRDNEAVITLKQGLPYTEDNKALKGQFYALLGDSYYTLNAKDSAFYFYEEALKLNDRNLAVLNNYSYYLSLEGKDLDKAERMSSRTIELEPGNATYLDTYAWVLFKRAHYLEAKFIIERAIDNGGDTNDVIVEHYGDILYQNNDVEGALIQWNKALLLGSKSYILKKKIEFKKYLE